MANVKSLPDCFEEILDAAHQRLKDAIEPVNGDPGPLHDVRLESIVRGNRARPMPELPSLWVFGEAATQDHTTQGLGEQWVWPVVVAAIVKNEMPEDGYREATDLASRAMQELLGRDRRLGLNFVNDVTASSFEPSSAQNSDEKRSLFWADGVVQVRFRRIEP